MARKQGTSTSSGRSVLVVDDSQEFLVAAERLLRRNGHSVIAIDNPVVALEQLRRERVDLILVDFFMPEMTGEVFVEELRRMDPLVPVILQTGYASEQSPRELVRRMDIQGYHDKSEGPDKLLLWTDLGLKASRTVRALEKTRDGLRYVASGSLELHRRKPATELFRALLDQAKALAAAAEVVAPRDAAAEEAPMSVAPSSLAALTVAAGRAPDVFITFGQVPTDFVIRAGTGRFKPGTRAKEALSAEDLAALESAVRDGRAAVTAVGTAVPLLSPDGVIGAVFFDRPAANPRDLELFAVFGRHAAIALENALFQGPASTMTPPRAAVDDEPPTERRGSAA